MIPLGRCKQRRKVAGNCDETSMTTLCTPLNLKLVATRDGALSPHRIDEREGGLRSALSKGLQDTPVSTASVQRGGIRTCQAGRCSFLLFDELRPAAD